MRFLVPDGESGDNDKGMSEPGVLGDEIYVKFPVRDLAKPKIAWLNERWFLERKIDIFEPGIRVAVEAELIEKFAVTSHFRAKDAREGTTVKYLSADRYGGTSGAFHGGSGRTGAFGGFNAKGVGQTPLVSLAMDRFHRNGLLPLQEAIREAIGSEIAHHALPHGAVPTIAIIDTGTSYRIEGETEDIRGAIIVRPNFIRPAHFERTIFFGAGDIENHEQRLDAKRVRDAVTTFGKHKDGFPAFGDMLLRFAEQIGTAQAKRLWQGQFLTSNLSVDGRMADFGAFRAVRDWRRAVGLAGECFGTEPGQLREAALSILFYFSKYLDIDPIERDLKTFLAELKAQVTKSFLDTCLQEIGCQDATKSDFSEDVGSAFQAYFEAQQKYKYGDGNNAPFPWIYTLITGSRTTGAYPHIQIDKAESTLIRLLKQGIEEGRGFITENKVKSLFKVSSGLIYSNNYANTKEFVNSLNDCANIQFATKRYIDGRMNDIALRPKHLPSHIDVLWQRRSVSSLVCKCHNLEEKKGQYIFECPRIENFIYLFDCKIDINSVDAEFSESENGTLRFAAPADSALVRQFCSGHITTGAAENARY